VSEPRTSHPDLAAWTALRASGARHGALVTLVRANGGAAQSLGTHLAVAEDGRLFGSVTVGGCADGRALEAAHRVIGSGQRELLTLPLSEADALALGLGCAGNVEMLVEPVALSGHDAVAAAFDHAARAAQGGDRVTLVSRIGDVCSRLLVREDGSVEGGCGSVARDAEARALALSLAEGANTATGLHEHAGSTWFVEQLAPARTLLIVGATELAIVLCALAAPLGWRAVLLDSRDELLEQPRFALAAERIASMPAEVVARRMQGAHAPAVVIVAHDYRVELPVLRAALMGDAPYVGMLGSRARGAAMRQTLLDDGIPAERVARLRSPIGLAIGAQGPAEIAVSIVAELIATWRGAAPRP
jgi:xanthine dehydrogenase accessory factor